jgi:hypothetical protein
LHSGDVFFFAYMTYENLLKQLAAKLGIPELKPTGENGQCPLAFNNKYQLVLEKGLIPGTFFVYTVLCPIPQNGRQELFDLLMTGHLFGAATAGATFGASSQIGQVLMYRQFELEGLKMENFHKSLEEFVRTYIHWHEQINKGMVHTPPAKTPVQS